MQVDVLVIGGGIVGTTVARELQAGGRSVTLIDQGPIGRGCSAGNAGWVTPCFAMPLPQPGMLLKSIGWLLDPTSPLHIHPSPSPRLALWLWRFMRAMNRTQMLRSIAALTDISKYSLEFYSKLPASTGFEKRGLLMVSSTRQGLAAAHEEMKLMSERGISGRALSGDEVRTIEPTLRQHVLGGVLFPDEAQIEPLEATLQVARDFEALGGRILTGHEVYDFDVARDGTISRVRTTQGEFAPALVVLAAGSWSHALGSRLGVGVPVLGGKGYSMTLPGVQRTPSRPIMIVERKIAITPFNTAGQNRLRAAGTLELVDQDFSISPRRLAAIHNGVHEYLDLGSEGGAPPHGQPAPVDVWRGLRPCTPDGVPMVGFSRKRPNLFYCTGHQMLGLQSAPGTARLAGDLVLGRSPLTDPAPFSPIRFE